MKSLPFNSLDQVISLTSYALNNGLFLFNRLGFFVVVVCFKVCHICGARPCSGACVAQSEVVVFVLMSSSGTVSWRRSRSKPKNGKNKISTSFGRE